MNICFFFHCLYCLKNLSVDLLLLFIQLLIIKAAVNLFHIHGKLRELCLRLCNRIYRFSYRPDQPGQGPACRSHCSG